MTLIAIPFPVKPATGYEYTAVCVPVPPGCHERGFVPFTISKLPLSKRFGEVVPAPLFTVTVMPGDVPWFAEVSSMRAVSVYKPFGSALVSHETLNGASASATPTGFPFTRSCADATPTLSFAEIAIGTTPETVALFAGLVIAPFGAITSPPASASAKSSTVSTPVEMSP